MKAVHEKSGGHQGHLYFKSVPNLMEIHTIFLEMYQFGLKLWASLLISIPITKAMLIVSFSVTCLRNREIVLQ